jgi:uncharacterized membrane protein YphA (DoxX/SURF4 family)
VSRCSLRANAKPLSSDSVDWVATIASIVLGVAFLVAGASKLAAGAAWPEQARGLGAPRIVIPVLPWVEIVIGAALLTQVGRVLAAVGALVLLMAFTGLVGFRLSQGRHPPCACFGSWSAKPIGSGTVWRNVALILLALVSIVPT